MASPKARQGLSCSEFFDELDWKITGMKEGNLRAVLNNMYVHADVEKQ